jgi:hypothetical protein
MIEPTKYHPKEEHANHYTTEEAEEVYLGGKNVY